jgi:hypothetical protein
MPIDVEASNRRAFIRHTASLLAVGGAACAAPGRTPVAAVGPAFRDRESSRWDDSWVARLAVPHKAAFEQSEMDHGSATAYAVRYLGGMREALNVKDDEVRVVLVLRHGAVGLVLNDSMWKKYSIGEYKQLKTIDGSGWAVENPIASTRPGTAAERLLPPPRLDWLAAHGHIVLGCDLALNNTATFLAKRLNQDRTAVYEEFRNNLLPGVILQPNGIYAMLRAQEAGCTAIRCP